jgi:hypothetical protein
MRRPIILVGFALVALTSSRPVAAQQFGGVGGSSGNMAEQYAKEGKEQVARAKQYMAAPNAKAYMSAPRPSLKHGTVQSGGRFDMSGNVPPAYFQVRDPSSLLSRQGYMPTASRRPASRSSYYPKAATLPPAKSGRRAAFDSSIPPAPR